MFGFYSKPKELNTTQQLDEIEKIVYAHLKPLGFRRHGRTLHRFVSGDISQLINFQCHYHNFCVNLGIRVPECADKTFHPQGEIKKYYHEYECNIRSRLGTVSGKRETWFELSKSPEKIAKSIIREIDEKVLPAFDVLNSRDSILAHRRDFPLLDSLNPHLILLEESMIHGHLGNPEKAKELFEAYYRSAVDEYNDRVKNGRKQYLKKGERVVFMGQDITAEKDGFVTLYGANHGHIDYLDNLAVKLGIRPEATP